MTATVMIAGNPVEQFVLEELMPVFPVTENDEESESQSNGRQATKGFLVAVALVIIGLIIQFPDVLTMIRHSRAMADLPRVGPGHEAAMSTWTPAMIVGSAFLLLGLVVGAKVLFGAPASRPTGPGADVDSIQHGRLRPIYWATCAALTLAIVVDIMKPLTIGFVIPGLSHEYGQPTSTTAVLALSGLTGTAIGSVVWGVLADRFGRRAAMLLATLLFVATSVCGAMPTFAGNLVMCLIMGMSAGGLLPLVFTLIAELTPARHRGWVAVTVGGIGGVGGYLAASAAAHFLEPSFTWRSLWLIGVPTGLVLMLLAPLLPESPLFLLRVGRRAEAEAVLRRYGAHLGTVVAPTGGQEAAEVARGKRSAFAMLFRRYPRITAVIAVTGVVWGMVNFGFLVLLPSRLEAGGMSSSVTSGLLAKSSLYSLPAIALVVVLYAFWNARRALTLFLGLIALSLALLALWSSGVLGAAVLPIAVGLTVLALSAVNAMLLPYSTEIYSTALRATGAGLAGAATKVGGVVGPSCMLLMLAVDDSLLLPAVVLGALCLLSAALMLRYGKDIPGFRQSDQGAVTGAEPALSGADRRS